MSTIQFSVHRKPGKDAEGNDTYHVRQETFGTVNKQQLMAHIAHHGLLRPELLEMAMTVLEREIVEHLLLGHRLHPGSIMKEWMMKAIYKHLKDNKLI